MNMQLVQSAVLKWHSRRYVRETVERSTRSGLIYIPSLIGQLTWTRTHEHGEQLNTVAIKTAEYKF